MGKPIQEQIFRSRLTITYRTTISGVPVEEKLPLRLLVLGNFSGRPDPDPHRPRRGDDPLDTRAVRSIKRGTKVDSVMDEMRISLPLPTLPPSLRPPYESKLTLPLRGAWTGSIREDEEGKRTLVLSETWSVKSARDENGLGDIDVALSLSAEKDLAPAPDPGQPVDIEVDFTVKGRAGGDVAARFDGVFRGKLTGVRVQGEKASGEYAVEVGAPRRLPIRGIASFTPDAIAQSTEEVRRLLVIKALLSDLQFVLNTTEELRDLVRARLVGLDQVPLEALEKLQRALAARYPALSIAGPPAPGAEAADDALLAQARDAVLPGLADAAGVLGHRRVFEKMKGQMPAPLLTVATPGDRPTGALVFHDRDATRTDWERLVNSLLAFVVNAAPAALRRDRVTPALIKAQMAEILAEVDRRVHGHVGAALRDPALREMEAAWRGLADLAGQVETEEVIIDLLDVTREELRLDFQEHDTDIFQSALFKKVYVDEYDRYGGKPFGAMIGLYEFDDPSEDVRWLRTMSKIANAAHCPFIASVAPRFFGMDSAAELEAMPNLDAVMQHPRYGEWDAFRETDGAVYIGLTLPRYLLRRPWGAEIDEGRVDRHRNAILYREEITRSEGYLWGSSAILMARNLVRSFEGSGWCQHIRGPRGGGMIRGLPIHVVRRHEQEEIQPPVEIAIADFRELQLAQNGFIPLIHKKGTADATFFSARSVKKPMVFQDDIDTKNADLIANLAYTLSITRIAHYVKRIARDYIGSSADAPYIQGVLDQWLKRYITTITNPDDLTLLYYPFKAASVTVEPKHGPLGWYRAVVSILPHVQFEGMDVELRLEASLGGK